MLCLCADIRSYKVYLVYAVPPISWQRSRLIVWKVCKTENLEWFRTLYSSIMLKGRTDRDSLKGGYKKINRRKCTTQYQYGNCRTVSLEFLVKTIFPFTLKRACKLNWPAWKIQYLSITMIQLLSDFIVTTQKIAALRCLQDGRWVTWCD